MGAAVTAMAVAVAPGMATAVATGMEMAVAMVVATVANPGHLFLL